MDSVKTYFKQNSLYDRVNKLLVSYDLSDCNFHVSGREFKAHKLILAISSPVFEAMLYGPLSTNDSIAITDIEPNIFQLLLNYIYTDKVDILSIEDAYDLLYASKKYLLESLTVVSLEYIHSNTNIDNVVHILNHPDYMQDDEIVTCALKLLCQYAHHLLEEYKHEISIATWKKILESSEVNIKEKDLIMILFEWSFFYAKNYKLNTEVSYRRDILIKTGLFKLLRFLTLSIDDLDTIVNDKFNLLLPDEILDIRHVITKIQENENDIEKDEQLNFVPVPRSPMEIKLFLCHRPLIRSQSPITIDSDNNCIQSTMKADKSFFLHSLRIQSRMAPTNHIYNTSNVYNEDFIILVMSDKSIISEFGFKKDVGYDCCLDIEISQPLCIRRGQLIEIDFIWPCLSLYDTHHYSVQSRGLNYTMVSNNKIKFEFQDFSTIPDSSGSFLKGFKYCM